MIITNILAERLSSLSPLAFGAKYIMNHWGVLCMAGTMFPLCIEKVMVRIYMLLNYWLHGLDHLFAHGTAMNIYLGLWVS